MRYILLLLFLIFAALPIQLNAQLVDNFNSKQLGDPLVWYPEWSQDETEMFIVQGIHFVSGNAVANVSSVSDVIISEFDPTSASEQYFYMKSFLSPVNWQPCKTDLLNNTYSTEISIQFADDGNIVATDGNSPHNLTTYDANTWYYIGVKWDTGQYRVKINDGDWSAYFSSDFNELSSIGLTNSGDPDSDDVCYWDDFNSSPNGSDESSGLPQSLFSVYLGDKVPFVYFFQLKDLFDDMTSQSIASSDQDFVSISAPFPAIPSLNVDAFNIQLLDMGFLYDLMPLSSWHNIRSLFAVMIIIGFGFYIFHRVKHLHLG